MSYEVEGRREKGRRREGEKGEGEKGEGRRGEGLDFPEKMGGRMEMETCGQEAAVVRRPRQNGGNCWEITIRWS